MRPQSDTSGTVEIGFGEYFLPQHAHALLLLAYELLCKFHEGRKTFFFPLRKLLRSLSQSHNDDDYVDDGGRKTMKVLQLNEKVSRCKDVFMQP